MNQDKNLSSFSNMSHDYPNPLWNIAVHKIKGYDWKNNKEKFITNDNEESNTKEQENAITKKELIDFYTDEIFTDEFQDYIYQLHKNIKSIFKESLGCVYDKDSYCDFFDFVKYNSTLYYQIERELNEKK